MVLEHYGLRAAGNPGTTSGHRRPHTSRHGASDRPRRSQRADSHALRSHHLDVKVPPIGRFDLWVETEVPQLRLVHEGVRRHAPD